MGRRRQVIGILVLQLGIVIHSPVIGLTGSECSASSFDRTYISVLRGTRVDFCPDETREHERSQLHTVVASKGASVDDVESVVAEAIALTLAAL